MTKVKTRQKNDFNHILGIFDSKISKNLSIVCINEMNFKSNIIYLIVICVETSEKKKD